MGDFRIKIEAVGGHGCQRDAEEGSEFIGCGKMGCPDCLARKFVKDLADAGVNVKHAEFRHWPGDLPGYDAAKEVVDDLDPKDKDGRRRGYPWCKRTKGGFGK